MTSNFPDGRGGLAGGVQFPGPVPVQSPEGQGVVAQVPTLQFPPNPYNYYPAHVPYDPPPQGPPLLYSDNDIPYPIQTNLAFQPPPNASTFGACTNDQFPPWLFTAASVTPDIPPNGFVAQPQMQPMGSPPQYAIPANVAYVETVNAAIPDEPQQEQEDGSEIAQPGGEPRYRTLPCRVIDGPTVWSSVAHHNIAHEQINRATGGELAVEAACSATYVGKGSVGKK